MRGKKITSFDQITHDNGYVLVSKHQSFQPDDYQLVYSNFIKIPEKKPQKVKTTRPLKLKQPQIEKIKEEPFSKPSNSSKPKPSYPIRRPTRDRDKLAEKYRKKKEEDLKKAKGFYPRSHNCVKEELRTKSEEIKVQISERRRKLLENSEYKKPPRHVCHEVQRKALPISRPPTCSCEPWMKCPSFVPAKRTRKFIPPVRQQPDKITAIVEARLDKIVMQHERKKFAYHLVKYKASSQCVPYRKPSCEPASNELYSDSCRAEMPAEDLPQMFKNEINISYEDVQRQPSRSVLQPIDETVDTGLHVEIAHMGLKKSALSLQLEENVAQGSSNEQEESGM